MAKLPLVEYAVDNLADAEAATLDGAGRIELCARLDRGGLTPPVELVREARRRLEVPFVTMVRPHDRGYNYDINELARMEADAAQALEAGSSGLVIGPLRTDDSVDVSAVQAFVNLAEERAVVFHRAFDLSPDPYWALEALIDCGVTRVLTSGGSRTALEGAARIARLVDRAAGRIVVVACGAIRDDSLAEVVRLTGVSEVHRRYVPPVPGEAPPGAESGEAVASDE